MLLDLADYAASIGLQEPFDGRNQPGLALLWRNSSTVFDAEAPEAAAELRRQGKE